MKIFLNPNSTETEGGIRRVLEAQVTWFRALGHSIVSRPEGADVIINHGTLTTPNPGSALVISHTHGAYWQENTWLSWALEANRRIAEGLEVADHLVTPSKWVQRAFARGCSIRSTVIYHGIDIETWGAPERSDGFILWNKSRVDPVSDPEAVPKLADRLPSRQFVTTFGEERPNIRVTGPMPYGRMKRLVKRAGVYLVTTRETFGIGTLEALASGVPVVGWRFGGQEEIIIQGETGILVDPGDYDGLAEAIEQVLSHRERFSSAALEDARTRWRWQDKIEQYSNLLETLLSSRGKTRVSVVIPVYNLGRYLPDAVSSVLTQGLPLEVIIVDDGSTDPQTLEVLASLGSDSRLQVYRLPENRGLSEARNFGASKASGDYLLFLDADDCLEEGALRRLVEYLDTHRNIHVAYGGIVVADETLSNRRKSPWPGTFDWVRQISRQNQCPYASLWRRDAFLRTGGYRTRDWRAEDASLWVRASSYGLRISQATEAPTLIYRIRPDSKTHTERAIYGDSDGDWTAWYPWRLPPPGDINQLNPALVPFAAPRVFETPWPIRHHQEPAVSVIIPVGPGHGKYLVDSLDSLLAQTVQSWEAIVVIDGDSDALSVLENYAWVETIVLGPDPRGAGAARNAGIQRARAPLLVFLDADDMLVPRALERFLEVYVQCQGYVYCDVQIPEHPYRLDLKSTVLPAAEYDRRDFLSRGYRPGRPGGHSVTALVPREDAIAVGGFDETFNHYEDWEFFLRLATHGVCGTRIPEPLLVYRSQLGHRRPTGGDYPELTIMEERYSSLVKEASMPCGCGSGGQSALRRAESALSEIRQTVSSDRNRVLLEYIGDLWSPVYFRGPVSREMYRAGRQEGSRIVSVDVRDVEGLLRSGQWERLSSDH